MDEPPFHRGGELELRMVSKVLETRVPALDTLFPAQDTQSHHLTHTTEESQSMRSQAPALGAILSLHPTGHS